MVIAERLYYILWLILIIKLYLIPYDRNATKFKIVFLVIKYINE